MSHDAQIASSGSPARQLAFIIGLIADTTEWRHTEYQALTARLLALGMPVLAISLGDMLTAITATVTTSETPHAEEKGQL